MEIKASLEWKSVTEHLPKEITLVIPEEKCNLNSWNDYIKDTLIDILKTRVSVKYDILEDSNDNS